MMKGLALLFSLILAVAFAAGESGSTSAIDGQFIAVSSPTGVLEVGRDCTIAVDLKNTAAASHKDDPARAFGAVGEKAIGIAAELHSIEGDVTVLSGPQYAGSLGPGENRSVQFAVGARDDAALGVHPLELVLSYSLLSEVEAAGDESLPDITFRYSDVSKAFPLEVNVSLGPRITLEEVKNCLAQNGESFLEIAFINRGDAEAENLHARISRQEPFSCISCAAALNDLSPGERKIAKFGISAGNAAEGDYALPCLLSYTYRGAARQEETAVHIRVENWAWMRAYRMQSALLMLAIVLLVFGIYIAKGSSRRRRPKRRL